MSAICGTYEARHERVWRIAPSLLSVFAPRSSPYGFAAALLLMLRCGKSCVGRQRFNHPSPHFRHPKTERGRIFLYAPLLEFIRSTGHSWSNIYLRLRQLLRVLDLMIPVGSPLVLPYWCLEVSRRRPFARFSPSTYRDQRQHGSVKRSVRFPSLREISTGMP